MLKLEHKLNVINFNLNLHKHMDSNNVAQTPEEIISALESVLNNYEEGDGLTKDLRRFRDKLITAHWNVEICLELLICKKLFKSEYELFHSLISPIFDKLEFSKKLNLASDLDAISDFAMKDIYKLNKIRNDLIHKNRKQIDFYKTLKGQKEILMTVTRSLLACNHDLQK
jgi:hypothetical protein